MAALIFKENFRIAIKRKQITYGQRSFQFAGPHLWNNPPLHIKQAITISSFKTFLKTYLFKSSYTYYSFVSSERLETFFGRC